MCRSLGLKYIGDAKGKSRKTVTSIVRVSQTTHLLPHLAQYRRGQLAYHRYQISGFHQMYTGYLMWENEIADALLFEMRDWDRKFTGKLVHLTGLAT